VSLLILHHSSKKVSYAVFHMHIGYSTNDHYFFSLPSYSGMSETTAWSTVYWGQQRSSLGIRGLWISCVSSSRQRPYPLNLSVRGLHW